MRENLLEEAGTLILSMLGRLLSWLNCTGCPVLSRLSCTGCPVFGYIGCVLCGLNPLFSLGLPKHKNKLLVIVICVVLMGVLKCTLTHHFMSKFTTLYQNFVSHLVLCQYFVNFISFRVNFIQFLPFIQIFLLNMTHIILTFALLYYK